MSLRKNVSFMILAAAVGLAGCQHEAEISATAGDLSGETPVPSSFTQFPDVPSPTGARIVVDRTLVLGSDDTWTGQLVMQTKHGPFTMFDFFKQRLPEFGWSEITSVRAPTSVLTYERKNRIGTFQIAPRSIQQGSTVTITVSPADARGQGTPLSRPANRPAGSSR